MATKKKKELVPLDYDRAEKAVAFALRSSLGIPQKSELLTALSRGEAEKSGQIPEELMPRWYGALLERLEWNANFVEKSLWGDIRRALRALQKLEARRKEGENVYENLCIQLEWAVRRLAIEIEAGHVGLNPLSEKAFELATRRMLLGPRDIPSWERVRKETVSNEGHILLPAAHHALETMGHPSPAFALECAADYGKAKSTTHASRGILNTYAQAISMMEDILAKGMSDEMTAKKMKDEREPENMKSKSPKSSKGTK
jgi:hypothetical protein